MKESRWVSDFSEAWAREYPEAENTEDLLLISRLARLSVLIEAFQADTLAPLELMPSDYEILAALRRTGPPYTLAPTELATALERSSGGMTKMLKRLEALELVSRVPDPDDGRSLLVRLTETGKEMEERAFEAFLARTRSLLRPTPARELRAINDAVERLVQIIEAGFER